MVFLDGQVPSFQKWIDWYAKYIKKEVFESRDGAPGMSSSLYRKYFRGGCVDWLGKVNRFARYKHVEILNQPFEEFCLQERIPVPTTYRKCKPSWEAGFRSAAKYDRAQPSYDLEAWNLSYDWTLQHFHPFMGGSRVVDLDTAIKDMNMMSSPGFPWNLEYQTKRDFLASNCSVLDDYWQVISGENVDNIVPIWSSTVKDELRHVSKLKEHGAEYDRLRTFTASPFEHSSSCNRLYVDMNNRFYDSALKTFSFVGVGKYYGGFDAGFRKLSIHPNAFALDESSFDASLFTDLMLGNKDMRWEFLDPQDKTPANWKRHNAIYDSIINTTIVLETGDLCQKDTGNPSGSGNTIVDNTLSLFRIFAYAFIVLCKEQFKRVPTYRFFMEHVVALLNGDDNTFTCSDQVVVWFHAKSIAKVWGTLGVVTTPSQDVWEPRRLQDCDFLSHTFLYYPRGGGFWLPCPETGKVLSSLMYGSDYQDVRWHLLRAYALRIDSWPNIECRGIISRYITFLYNRYRDSMCGQIVIKRGIVFNMLDIQSLFKSDAEIEQLYIGCESSALNESLVQGISSIKEFVQLILNPSSFDILDSSESVYFC